MKMSFVKESLTLFCKKFSPSQYSVNNFHAIRTGTQSNTALYHLGNVYLVGRKMIGNN